MPLATHWITRPPTSPFVYGRAPIDPTARALRRRMAGSPA